MSRNCEQINLKSITGMNVLFKEKKHTKSKKALRLIGKVFVIKEIVVAWLVLHCTDRQPHNHTDLVVRVGWKARYRCPPPFDRPAQVQQSQYGRARFAPSVEGTHRRNPNNHRCTRQGVEAYLVPGGKAHARLEERAYSLAWNAAPLSTYRNTYAPHRNTSRPAHGRFSTDGRFLVAIPWGQRRISVFQLPTAPLSAPILIPFSTNRALWNGASHASLVWFFSLNAFYLQYIAKSADMRQGACIFLSMHTQACGGQVDSLQLVITTIWSVSKSADSATWESADRRQGTCIFCQCSNISYLDAAADIASWQLESVGKCDKKQNGSAKKCRQCNKSATWESAGRRQGTCICLSMQQRFLPWTQQQRLQVGSWQQLAVGKRDNKTDLRKSASKS